MMMMMISSRSKYGHGIEEERFGYARPFSSMARPRTSLENSAISRGTGWKRKVCQFVEVGI